MLLRICFAPLVLLVCLTCSVGGEKIGEFMVQISGLFVNVICPTHNPTWKKPLGNTCDEHNETLTCEINGREDFIGYFSCEENGASRSIYLQIRACEDCIELGIEIMAGIVVFDLLITLIVLILVYYCSRRRAASTGEGTGGKSFWEQSQDKKADRPPPVPNPDYEPIRKGQREVYAGLEPKAF